MARPIRETPILTGEDAERFVSEMQQVDEMPKEERSKKKRELQEQYAAILKKITICLWFLMQLEVE